MMDIDDSSDKIRRNLLMFSFVIVASSFLDLSIQKQAKIFSAVDFASVSHYKFWLLIAGVLIYLFYRYWFDSNTTNAIDHYKSEYSNYRYKLLKKLLNKDIEKSLLENKTPKYFRELSVLSDKNIVARNSQNGNPIEVSSSGIPQFNDWQIWSGQMTNAISLKWENDAFATSGGATNIFTFTPVEQIYFKCRITLKLFIYSKSITDLITPIALFIIALYITIFRILGL